jgi:hypothetical protein
MPEMTVIEETKLLNQLAEIINDYIEANEGNISIYSYIGLLEELKFEQLQRIRGAEDEEDQE